MKSIAYCGVTNVLYIVMIIAQEIYIRQNYMIADIPQDQLIAIYCSLTFINLSIFLTQNSSSLYFGVCSVILKEELNQVLSRKDLTVEAMKELINCIRKIQESIGNIGFSLFLSFQIGLILAIYTIIADYTSVHSWLTAVFVFIFTYSFVDSLDESYALANQLVFRAHEESANAGKES